MGSEAGSNRPGPAPPRPKSTTLQVDFLIGSFLALSSFGIRIVTKALDPEGSSHGLGLILFFPPVGASCWAEGVSSPPTEAASGGRFSSEPLASTDCYGRVAPVSLDRSAGAGDASVPVPESSLVASTLGLECFGLVAPAEIAALRLRVVVLGALG